MDDCSERSKQSRKSGRMAHWTGTGSRSLPLDDWKVTYSSKNDGLLIPPEVDAGSSKLVKGYREGTKIRLINFVDESLTTSSKNLRSESVGTPFLPLLTSLQNGETVLVPSNGETFGQHEGVLTFDTGLNPGINGSHNGADNYLPKVPLLPSSGTESQLRKSPFQPEGITWNWEEEAAGKSNLDVSEHLQDNILGSTSEIVQHVFNSVRTSIQPSHNHIYQSGATFFILDKRMDKKESLSIHDPSTSNNRQRSIIGKQSQEVNNHSEIKLSHSHINSPDMSKLEKFHHGSYGLPGRHSSVHDVGRVRIYTTVDSVQEFPKEPPKFSRTTNHLMITEKTDVNLSDVDQTFGKLSMPTNLKGKAVYELFSLSSHFGSNVKQGVKLQPLDSPAESEGKVIVDHVKTSATNTNPESSDDTDTLEMHTFKENHLCGLSFTPSNKDVKESKKMAAAEASIPSMKGEGRDKLKPALPDINQDIPVSPDMAKSEDDKETSTSRTKSLDVSHFLSHAKHPRDLKSSTYLDVNFGVDPCSRWVKRLKPNASGSFGHGTESSRMEEASSREKVDKFFHEILNCNTTSSEPKMIKSCGKEHILINRTKLPTNDRSPSSCTAGRSQEIRVLHTWIQRWRRVQTACPKGISGDAVGTEPKTSKTTLDFQKKQFPSIAAIALMGNAIPGFHPCKFRKKGSVVVWNAWDNRDKLYLNDKCKE